MALARTKAVAAAEPRTEQDNYRDPVATEAAVLALLTAWFASKPAITATELPDDLINQLVGIGIARKAAGQVGRMVLARRLTGRSRHGSPNPYHGMPATRRVAAGEPRMRAQYVLAAAKRLTQGIADGVFDQALEKERRYLDAHVDAGRNRRRAARRLDELGENGQVLVWRTVMDQRTTPECAALDGRLFTADNPPGIPGAMHSRCRCRAEVWGRGPLLNWGANAS